MVLILDGDSELVAQREGKCVFSDKKYPIYDCSSSIQEVVVSITRNLDCNLGD